MKSVMIYADPAFVAKANASLQRIGLQRDVGARWATKSWPISELKERAIAEESLTEAADAHLIMVPAQYARILPFHLREWLERWAAVRRIQDAALAVISDGIHVDFTETVSPELTRLVQQHGLKFIIDEGPVARDAAKPAARFPHDSELPPALELRRITYAATRDSFRSFGINE